MRRINTGTVGRPLLARLVSVDNQISSLVPNENITFAPNGSGDVVIASGPQLLVQNTTNSTSTTSGCAVFSGGIGVANNVYAGGNLNAAGTLTSQYLTAAASTHMTIPSGTTAQRPGSPSEGMVRFNTDYGHMEWYNGSSWTVGGFQDVTVTANRTSTSWQTNWIENNGITVTLPASPARGDRIRFFGLAANTSFTVARNGKLINSDAADLSVTTEDAAFELVFNDNTYGWRIFTI